MSGRRLRFVAGALPLLLAGLALLARGAAAQESCQSAQCHATLVQGKAVHEAAESCDNCHEATATAHPQKGAKTFKLTEPQPGLCTNCHDGLTGKAQVHEALADGCTTCHSPHASNNAKLLLKPQKELCSDCHSEPGTVAHPHGPVEAGDCTACHTPHSSDIKPLLARKGDALCVDCHSDISDLLQAKKVKHPALDDGCTSCHQPHGGANPKLLAEAGPALCFQCHDDIADKVQKSPVVHAALASAKGCASCHSPHAADQKKLLLEPEKEICLGCHAKTVTPEMTVLHGPIRDGSCTACHEPHGTAQAKLLKESFPATAYVPYTDTAYALCFGCHDRDLLKYPDTSFATGFRDGERNLHFLHVNNAQKGRSCALCHSLHGATNEVLIADSVAFGSWKLPLKFVKTESGGSCAPGCHRPAAYDRKTPAKKP
jgi:predicted CXXCH cytochrome family protein